MQENFSSERPSRPVQFNITNHIDKCEEEAIQQKQWLDSGGSYYLMTTKLFKERANKLREIASMYDELYFSSLHTNRTIQIVEVTQTDDLTDTNILNNVETNENTAEVSINSVQELESLSIFSLVEYYKSAKKSGQRNAITSKTVKRMKQEFGNGFDNLQNNLTEVNSAVNTLCILLRTWFNQRCDWPHKESRSRYRYNLSKVPESIDAIVLAFAVALCDSNQSIDAATSKFSEELNEWLYNEGEDHRRGQPEPFKKERNGLVSTSIIKYMNTPDVRSNDNSISSNAFKLAIAIENYLKPLIYTSRKHEKNTKLIDSYMHSLYDRGSTCYPQLKELYESDILNENSKYFDALGDNS